MRLEDDLSKRNFGLDLARAIAITLVLLSHGRAIISEFSGKILFSNGGCFGVELFFVLSGSNMNTFYVMKEQLQALWSNTNVEVMEQQRAVV